MRKKIRPSKSEEDLWIASDTPDEDWGDDVNEWPVDGVVSEEIDFMGTSRYEVRWRDWHRPDGTSTTWMKELPDRPDLIDDWNLYQKNKRTKQAEDSLNVALAPLSSLDIHNISTAKRSQAVHEKSEKSREIGLGRYANWDLMNDPAADVVEIDVIESQQDGPSIPSIQQKWQDTARKAGAASILIINDIDDEKSPPVPPGFKYLERKYSYPKDIGTLISDSEAYFLGCDCVDCSKASLCDCQDASELIDDDGEKTYAYTAEGLFTFNVPSGVEVVECNRLCSCKERGKCPNRVAQKPRDVPIEVFKTINRGWGARTTVDVVRGKVLGLYTGRVLSGIQALVYLFLTDQSLYSCRRREELETLPKEHMSYTFDLDARELGIGDEPLEKYSVTAYHQGNWTRFINHSCEPNVCVHPIVFETIPENIPFLAFIVSEDIPAYTELTLDYNPAGAMVKGKKKRKKRMPETAAPCACGTKSCRGWMRF